MRDKMIKFKKVAAIAATALLALGLGACSSTSAGGATGGDSTMKAIQQSGEMRYGVIVGEEPGFIQNTDGSWTGYLADTAQKIAEMLELEAVPVETTWANLALDLETNKIDIAVGVQPTGARALVTDYTSHPIYTNYFSLIVTSDRFDGVSWTELNDPAVTIGAQTGDSTLQPINTFAPDASIKEFDSRDKNLLALQ
jgi:polar amino acid transport system substrate-binding protein